MIETSIEINASLSRVWAVLKARVFHPQEFLPIEEIGFMNQSESEVLRKMVTPNGEVTERFVLDAEKYSIDSFLVKHPFFSGKMTQRVEGNDSAAQCIFVQDWKARYPEDQAILAEALQAALQQIKSIAEDASVDLSVLDESADS